MNDSILHGRGGRIIEIPYGEWASDVAEAPPRIKRRLNFMSENHRRVRYFVVRELPRSGEPLSPDFISSQLKMPLAQTKRILDELEARLFFEVCNEDGAVSWAFPVTVDPTPHRLVFSTGERLFGA